MRTKRIVATAVSACLSLAFLVATASSAWGQAAGVHVDADGVLRMSIMRDPGGTIHARRIAAARAALDPVLARPSKTRHISLNRLEVAIADLKARGEKPTHEMVHLAGLTGIEYVFYLPETRDIVIAGPAEGYVRDATGRAVGVETGKSVLELQDLIAALRAFPATGERTNLISVSIDPTAEGLTRMQQYIVQAAPRARPSDAARLAKGLKDNLGLQNVTIRGISPKTHFAQVLVEADYRMKMIGIGLERPPVAISSYISKAKAGSGSANALQRWYFTPDYDRLLVSEDKNAVQFVGQGVKLIGQDELVRADGTRVASGNVDRASKAFSTSFTEKYNELAEKSPVYGQLRNLIDMSIAAAFIQQNEFYGKAGWSADLLCSEDELPIEVYEAPTQVETAVNAVWKGNTLMTPIGGGVNIQPRQALTGSNIKTDNAGKVAAVRESVSTKDLPATQWWWD